MRNSMLKEYVISTWYLLVMKLVLCVSYCVSVCEGSTEAECLASLVGSVLVCFVAYPVGKEIEETYRRNKDV